jgi:hypothetical protein
VAVLDEEVLAVPGAWSRQVDCYGEPGSSPLPACAVVVDAIWGLEALAPPGARDAARAAGPDVRPTDEEYVDALGAIRGQSPLACGGSPIAFTVLAHDGAALEQVSLPSRPTTPCSPALRSRIRADRQHPASPSASSIAWMRSRQWAIARSRSSGR